VKEEEAVDDDIDSDFVAIGLGWVLRRYKEQSDTRVACNDGGGDGEPVGWRPRWSSWGRTGRGRGAIEGQIAKRVGVV